MRHSTIGEICNIKTGKLDANASSPNGQYPFFTCSREVLRIDHYAYDAECVLIAGNGELNVKYYNGKFNAYQRTYIITLKPTVQDISVKYLYTFFTKYIETLRKDSIGGVIKYIKLGNLTDAVIPVPPITEQEKIVAELDCLTGIIEKKKQQLEELDKLAQSIFYDMFGDPISNEKGWKVQSFSEVFRLKSGDGLKEKDFAGGVFPVYGGNGISGYHDMFNKSGKHIIIGRVGAYCGNVRFVQGDFWLTDNAFDAFFDADILDFKFSCYLLNTIDLHRYANHAAQPVISNTGLKAISIPLPSMFLQNEFAKKIEAIEKQKELIKKSIQETETLFNSRMDFWFNN